MYRNLIHRISTRSARWNILIPYYLSSYTLGIRSRKQMKENLNKTTSSSVKLSELDSIESQVGRIPPKCREVDKCIRSRMRLLSNLCIFYHVSIFNLTFSGKSWRYFRFEQIKRAMSSLKKKKKKEKKKKKQARTIRLQLSNLIRWDRFICHG